MMHPSPRPTSSPPLTPLLKKFCRTPSIHPSPLFPSPILPLLLSGDFFSKTQATLFPPSRTRSAHSESRPPSTIFSAVGFSCVYMYEKKEGPLKKIRISAGPFFNRNDRPPPPPPLPFICIFSSSFLGRGNSLLFLILGYPGLTVPLPKSPPSGRGQWAPAPAHPLRYFWAERIEPCALPKSPLEPRRGFAQTLSARTTLAPPRTLGNDTPPPLPSPFPFPAI